MGRTSQIDLLTVKNAVQILTEQNKTANASSIRVFLGGGSPNHIQKFLAELKTSGEFEGREGVSEIPKNVQEKLGSIYSELRSLAGLELKNLQAKHQIDLNLAREEIALFKNYSLELEQKVEELESQLFNHKVDEKVASVLSSKGSVKLAQVAKK